MIRTLVATVALGLFAFGGLSACTQPCDKDHVCTLDRDNNAMCDGSDYVVCDGSSRDKRVVCTASRVAVCSATGWTFENN